MQKQEAQNIIESTFNASFSEEKFTLFIKNLLNDIDTTRYNEYRGNLIKDAYKDHIRQYKRIGKYTDPNGDALDLLIVEVKDQTKLDKTRTSLRNFVISHLDSFEKDYALVAFYSNSDHGADWRFSFVKLEYKTEVKEGKLKQSKELTPAKRYSFLVGEHEKAHTAKKQLLPLLENVYNNPTLEELEEAFSIEKVTDEFFEQYKSLFLGLTEQFDKDQNGLKEQLAAAGIDIPRFTKKLLGQIVFLYFLQKKGWLGVPKTEKWGKGEKKYLQKLYDEAEENGKNFFGDYLQPLFYKALAHKHADEGIKGYYKTLGCKVPFLNGGLFEADYKWEESHITIPNHLFRNQDKVNKTGDVGTGVLDVFDRYNFTIKEDEPLEKEVAVDPEMLGKVFENMLEVTERKSKGAFYTPREIVHYMCQESLIHYLDNAVNTYAKTYQELGDNQTNLFGNAGKKGQQSLMQKKDQIIISKDDIEVFIRKGFFALENDQRVLREGKETKTYKFQLPESVRLNADLLDEKLTEIKICDPAIGSGAFPVGMLHEIVNARLVLRQYLKNQENNHGNQANPTNHSLPRPFGGSDNIPDNYAYQLKRHTIQESIYGVDIDASAIDIARLRLWLSLVVDEEDLDNIEALPNLDYKIVCGNSLIGLPENAMRNLEVEKELEKLKEEFFAETDEAHKKELRTKINTKIRQLLDTAEEFAGYKIDFDFKLFFSEVWHQKNGFDVVIGNPPYVESKKLPLEIKNTFKNYKSATGKYDLYVLFIEKGLDISKKHGSLVFINPTTFMNKLYGKGLRKLLLEKYKINKIIDFADFQIFKGATNYTGIYHILKEKGSNYEFEVVQYYNAVRSISAIEFEHSLQSNGKFKFKETLWKSVSELSSDNWIITSSKHATIINLIQINSKPLKDFTKYIFVGIQSGKDEVFFVRDEDIEEYRLEREIIHPILKGKDVHQYYHTWSGNYIIYPYDKNGKPFPEITLSSRYPYTYEYLQNNRDKLSRRTYFDRSGKLWYELWCERVINKFKVNKIVNAEISSENRFSYDDKFYLGNTKIFNTVLKEGYNNYYLYFVGLLNSELLNYFHINIASKRAGGFYDYKTQYIEKYPIVFNTKYSVSLSNLVRYIIYLFSTNLGTVLITSYIRDIINSLVFELYLPNEIKSARKEILKHLGDLKPISDSMSEEEKLAIIQSEFERLYDPNHPVRNNVETLDSVEEVRIIKESLKK